MDSLVDSEKIKNIIAINNSLIRKKGLLKTLLEHQEVKQVLQEVINDKGKGLDDSRKDEYMELLNILSGEEWNLDRAIEKIIKEGVSK